MISFFFFFFEILKLFFSLTEACCCAVPMLLIPKFGDQPRNAERAQELGAGILLARSQYEDAECIRFSVFFKTSLNQLDILKKKKKGNL